MRAWQRWHATSCYACGRNLAYQSGAAVVKCPGCESVLNVRGLALQDVAGQAECTGCHQIMVFPAAAALSSITHTQPPVVPGLLCTTCSSYTPAPQPLYFNCAGCRLYVTYCARLSDVICAVCLTVFPPYNAPSPYPALAPLNPALRRPQRPPPVLPPSGARIAAPMLVRRSWVHVAPTLNVPTQPLPTTPLVAARRDVSSPQPTTPDLSGTLQPPLAGAQQDSGGGADANDDQNNAQATTTTTPNTSGATTASNSAPATATPLVGAPLDQSTTQQDQPQQQ